MYIYIYIYIYIHTYILFQFVLHVLLLHDMCIPGIYIFFLFILTTCAFNAQHVCIFIYIFTCNSHISPAPPIYVQLSDILNPSDLCTILQYPQPLRFTYNYPISHFLNLTCMLLLEHVLYLVSIIKFIKIYYHCINCF